MRLKIKRLLSSDQKQTALEGVSLLTKMNAISTRRIEILPESRISITYAAVLKNAGFESIHTSAMIKPTGTEGKTSFFEGGFDGVSDIKTIHEIMSLVS